jgi:hypothetical protein
MDLYSTLLELAAAPETARTNELLSAITAWRQQVGARMPTPNPDYDPVRASELARDGGRRKKQ